jgi:hypothetical protein
MDRGAVASRLMRIIALLTTLGTLALLFLAGGASFSSW